MPVEPAARIVVVEDDATLATALRIGLTHGGFEVRALGHGRGFAELVDAFDPDLGLLDVSLPEGPSGLELAGIWRARTAAPLMFITASDSLEDRLAGFEAGADDYVVKPFALAELIARIRAVLRRAGRRPAPVVHVRDLVIDENARTVSRDGAPVLLTPTEFDLFCALARKPGEVFSKGQLLSLVWGFDQYDPNLVEVHVSSLRRKVDTGAARLIHTERGRGYVLRP